jgi:hypothetical protein
MPHPVPGKSQYWLKRWCLELKKNDRLKSYLYSHVILLGDLYSLKIESWALVAHACNPSYSGGKDQEDQGSKPTQANSSQDHNSKNPITKNWASVGG